MKKLGSNEEIYQLLTAASRSAALSAAVELGLFGMLAEQPLDADAVAQIMNIPPQRCHYWLQLLHELGVLEIKDGCYIPSPLICEALINVRSQESWKHLAVDERERPVGVHNLALYIQEPGLMWAAQGMVEPKDYAAKMAASPAELLSLPAWCMKCIKTWQKNWQAISI